MRSLPPCARLCSEQGGGCGSAALESVCSQQQQLAQQQHMAQLHHNMMVMMGGQAALPMQGGFPHAAAMGAFGGAPPMQPGLDALSMQQQLAQALGQPPGAPSGYAAHPRTRRGPRPSR